MRAFVKILYPVLLLFAFSNSASAYVIQGRIKNYSPKWKNKIFFAAIRSIKNFEAISEAMKVNEADIDEQGNFKLQGDNLPEELAFYRVYLCTKDAEGDQLLAANDHNFIHLLLNNHSVVTINVDLQAGPIYDARITGAPYSTQFEAFYKNIYYLGFKNYHTPYTNIYLDQQKAAEVTKKSILKNHNPYYTIFTLSHIDWAKEYPADPYFFEKAVDDLQKQLPGNKYVVELENKRMVTAFQISPYKAYLNAFHFTLLLLVIGILLTVIAYLLWLARKKSQISNTIKVSTVSINNLTQKELEIAKLIANGRSNKEISTSLFIEVSTVKSHVSNIYQKLSISGRKELSTLLNAS